ncbi:MULTISPECIES: tail assembly protein [unclassified Serratia]|uniref:tail assembly protein n=1 Tax=unclassified Serratia (in: enterobacteria) TaxID=2647522 RepID=UPI0004686FCB
MAFIDVPMRKMIFHGPLIERFGRDFKYKAHNVPKMMSAAKSLLDGFERYMAEAHKRGLTFAVFVGNERKRNIAEAELEMTKGSEDIHLVPVIIGSKRAGLFQTILGVALIAISFTPLGAPIASYLMAAGASMALGGIAQMLSPQAGGLRTRESPDNKPSYAFGGPVNTTAQGNPVAVGYGCREIGGAVISAGIYTEDQQ